MSMHPQNGNGADGEPQGAPNVYHPYPDGRTAPVYEAYADPAAAHGWQGEYDEASYVQGAGDVDTEQLSVYVDEGDAGPRDESHGHGGSHRRARGRAGGPDRRRTIRLAAIAAGAACLVLLVAVIAGLFDSGSSGGPTPSSQGEEKADKKGGEPSAGESASATRQPGSGGDATASPSGTATTSKEPGDAESRSADPTDSTPTTKAPVTETPTTTAAPTADEPGNGNGGGNPGHGQGSTKGPR